MPPARKEGTEADDACRPSTSRSFSPALVPPVKRARTSLGASSSSSRRQSIGGRQARMEEFIDEKELQDGLLMVALKTAEEIMNEDEENGKEKLEIDSEVIQSTARIVWEALAEDWATDLIAFSKHAGRETIKEEDVKLMMRRNPDLLAQVMGECEDEDGITIPTAQRRSTGNSVGRPRKGTREEEDDDILIDDITTPQCTTSGTSVVPETPDSAGPLAHSTPVNGRGKTLNGRGRPAFTLPSPIREEKEETMDGGRGEGGGGNGSGRRVNRSIMGQLSATVEEEEKEGGDGMETQEMGEEDVPSMIDIRHPREQEEEEARMAGRGRDEIDRELEQMIVIRSQAVQQQAGPSTNGRDYGRGESPDLFEQSEGEEKKEYDSFDDDVVMGENENVGGVAEVTHGMNESAALREMLGGGEEEEEERRETREEEHDSFDDDDSIQFVEMGQKNTKISPLPLGDVPSTSATGLQSMGGSLAAAAAQSTAGVQPAAAAAVPLTAPAALATSQRNSQDSFLLDEILEATPPPPTASAAALPTVTVQQSTTPSSRHVQQPVEEYDSFDDDDDDFVSPISRSTETTPKAIAPPTKNTVANRWSTVEIQEVISPVAPPKNNQSSKRGAFAEDIFGLNDLPGPSKPSPTTATKPQPTVSSKPPSTVPSKRSPAVSSKPSPTISSKPSPTVSSKPVNGQSSAKQTPVSNTVKGPSSNFSSFSFFGEESSSAMPPPKREDSDFIDTSNRSTTTTMRTPRGRGGGRGRFPRKVDPNSRVNQMRREQSTPVRLSPRPPSRLSEVIDSFNDDDFDASAFDD